MDMKQKMGIHNGSKLFMSLSWGDREDVVFFQYFKAQKDEVLNVLQGLLEMMEVKLQIDPSKFFTYKAMERSSSGTWDPINRLYKYKEALYAEGVVDNMIADVPGYIPLQPTGTQEAEKHSEKILSPKHQKEFNRCMNDGTETVTVAPKEPIPIRCLAPGSSAPAPNPITPAKTPPSEVCNDDESVASTITDATFGSKAMDGGSVSTLGSVDTYGMIDTANVSSSSQSRFLCSKQKLQ